MAADDDDRGPAPEPWDEIVAEGLGEEAAEISFRFDDVASEPAPPASDTSADTSAEAGSGPEEAAFAVGGEGPATETPGDGVGDEAVEDWLSGDDDAAATPPLAVFNPGESATGSSGIDIGTGGSGVALHGDSDQEEIGAEAFTATEAVADDAFGGWANVAEDQPGATALGERPEGDSGDDDGVGFPAVAAGVAPAAAATATKPTRRPAKPAKKSGGIGQMIGVVLGGLMAIPITLAILIYGLGKDPFGVTKQVPAEVAFLLPEKFRPGYKKPRPADTGGTGGSALDNLPPVTEPEEPVDGSDAPTDEPAPAEPVDEPAPDADMPPATDVAAVDVPGLDAPGLDDLGGQPAAPAPVEPPPLDLAELDAAVGDASALGEALGAVDDTQNGAYRKLRTRWYRALARVAEELVKVENDAATSGRPLADAPDSVAALHDGIGRRERLAAELAALAPDWLAYAKRGSDGIVVPVTFESARRVGPYWTVRASLTGADGRPTDLTVVSRREPAAITGDRVVVTGVALDGTVIWAADVRGTAATALPPGF